MTDDNATHTDWIAAWLETQRGWLGRWQSISAEQRTDAMRVGMETLREHLDPQTISPEAINLAHSFQQLLLAGMHAGGEWAHLQAQQDGQKTGGMFDGWSMPALGPAREQQLAWQNLMRAQLDYQIRLQTLLGMYAKVFAESLEAVPQQVAQRAEQGRSIQTLRELYEVWIDGGEAAFARIAHDDAFIAAQAACGNALSELKRAQGALIEQWLKAHDLPTRSELNGVHQRLRDLQARVAELTAQSPASKTGAPRGTRRKAVREHADE